MVQVAGETPKQGAAWNIHMSSIQNHEQEDSMEDLRDAILAARIAEYEPPPSWMDNICVPPQGCQNITQRAIDIYMLSKKANGEMGGIGWWQSANGYTGMALHDLWSGNSHNYDTLCTAIQQCEARHKDLINVFNDDTLWWAMLCLHMCSSKGDDWFLERAQAIWKHIKCSVCKRGQVYFEGKDMEGAVFWTTKPDEEQINAISTGLFAELSVRLALVTKAEFKDLDISKEEYVEAARCSLGWILRCRYRPQQGLVLDHIKLKQGKAVDWIFTYNTGVALGVCALLFEVTRDDVYMNLAIHMAFKTMTRTGPRGWVEDDGVLTEKHAYGRGTHDPWKPNDAVGFKAVLIRQLGTLYDVIDRMERPDTKPLLLRNMIREFININLRSQLDRNTNGEGQYGPWWAGPFECPTSHSQMAVLDVMAAVRLMSR
jgi:hypothetical protein